VTLQRALDPEASWARLPLLRRLGLLSHRGIKLACTNVDNDLVLCLELLFPLALDVDVSFGDPAGAEVQVLLYAMPFLLV